MSAGEAFVIYSLFAVDAAMFLALFVSMKRQMNRW